MRPPGSQSRPYCQLQWQVTTHEERGRVASMSGLPIYEYAPSTQVLFPDIAGPWQRGPPFVEAAVPVALFTGDGTIC